MTTTTAENREEESIRHCGIIALVGRANVGKSTLLNCILQEKVSIVSGVAQTTRNLIRAVLTESRGQLVFLDTPGLHKASAPLNKIMNRTARTAVEGVDVITAIFDNSTPPKDEDEGWMRHITRAETQTVFLLNKSDLKKDFENDYRNLWQKVAAEKQTDTSPTWMKASSRTGEGVEELMQQLFTAVPPGPQLFPEDLLTDFPRRWAISDVIREKLFHLLHQELPHCIEVNVNDIDESSTTWKVSADVLVNTPSQKKIVIGYKGRLLRKVKRQALRELEEMFDVKFELSLWVKVEKHWDRNHWLLREMGYE